ncbi:MAG: thioredoxin domain-containing protein [Anaerolineae bacterium]
MEFNPINITRRWGVIIFVLAAVITACGPAQPKNQQDTGSSEGETAEFTTDERPVAGSTPLETAAEPDSPSAQTESEGEDAAPAAPTLAINAQATAVDASGVPVGFTEDGRPYRGNPDAPVVIEEFSDFQCPFCARFYQQTLPSLEENSIASGEVVLVYYDFPLTSIHRQAMQAANAARCAGEQGAASYWALHDLLFTNETEWANGNAAAVFISFAQDLGLNMDDYTRCLDEERYTAEIEADMALGRNRGVSSTPSFFINDQILVGAQPLSVFENAIASVQGGGEIAGQPPSQPAQPAAAPTPAVIAQEDAAATLGDASAPVTIVEYTDFQCPFCQRHASETMPQLMSEMISTGRVYYVVKDFPLERIHPEARAAAVAARCAGEQEAYWEMHDALFASQSEWAGQGAAASAHFATLTSGLGLDAGVFEQCYNDGYFNTAVQANLDEGISLGVRGTPHFFINGYPISGAQPYQLFEYAIGLAEAGTLADAYTQSAPAQEPEPTPPSVAEVPIDGAYSIGDPNAPVVFVEFTDFQCPFCGRHFQQTFPLIKENFVDTGLVRYVFKDFPLTNIHPQATPAAEAARCAGDQGAYLEMHDALFSHQNEWQGRRNAADLFALYAADLGLDLDLFNACLNDHRHEAAVMADFNEGVSLGVRGTPAFFLNGQLLAGAQPYAVFEQALNNLLQE